MSFIHAECRKKPFMLSVVMMSVIVLPLRIGKVIETIL